MKCTLLESGAIPLVLIAITVAQAAACCSALTAAQQDWPEPLALVAFALSFATIGICSTYLVCGPAILGLRISALFVAITSAVVVTTIGTRGPWTVEDARAWLAVLSIFAIYVVSPLFVLRAIGVFAPRASNLSHLRRGQFSVSTLLSIVTGFSFALAVLANADYSNGYVARMGRDLTLSFGWPIWLCAVTSLDERWKCVADRARQLVKSISLPPRMLTITPAKESKDTTSVAEGLVSAALWLACIVVATLLTYMVVSVAELILGIDRKALREFMAAPRFHEYEPEGHYFRDANSVEEAIAIVWQVLCTTVGLMWLRRTRVNLAWGLCFIKTSPSE